MNQIEIGFSHVSSTIVDESKTALHIGSGDALVFATPMMVALMENAAFECLNAFLEDGESSVGVDINTTHLSATPVGLNVKAEAKIKSVDGKKVSFDIIATDDFGPIGKATHTRFVINSEKFMQKSNLKLNNNV